MVNTTPLMKNECRGRTDPSYWPVTFLKCIYFRSKRADVWLHICWKMWCLLLLWLSLGLHSSSGITWWLELQNLLSSNTPSSTTEVKSCSAKQQGKNTINNIYIYLRHCPLFQKIQAKGTNLQLADEWVLEV